MPTVKQTMGKIDPIDKQLGELVRMARLARGITQEKLGALNNLTFQQIQKYERGNNRISVSRLIHIAECLETPVTWFLEKLGNATSDQQISDIDLTLFKRQEIQELLRSYVRIADEDERRFLRRMVTLAADSGH